MIVSSLRTRLILAFLAMVSLMLVVGAASFTIHHGIQSDVAALGARRGVDVGSLDLSAVSLEMEGHWDPAGRFVATEVDVLPGPRRPRLRGAIGELDLGSSTLTLYGRVIHVDDATEFDPREGPGSRLADLSSGQRVEATCEVTDGVAGRVWRAAKLRTTQVKASDKIKGQVTSVNPTAASPTEGAPLQVQLHGLPIEVLASEKDTPDSAMAHVETATRMLLAVAECRAVARELVERSPARENSAGDSLFATPPAERLLRSYQEFVQQLDHAHGALAAADGKASMGSLKRWVDRLLAQRLTLSAHVATLLDLHDTDLVQARTFVDDTLEPFLVTRLQPLANAYLSESQEEFGDQLREIVSRGAQTTRLALAASGLALIIAMALGLAVWRSVNRPIRALQSAALRLAGGAFDTRVQLARHDEFGSLAEAFNTMAAELQRTTISIEEKELLLREVHHRVKNNMQVVSSLLAMQASECEDPATVARLSESQGRIRSMALIHEQLYRSDDLAQIDVPSYLELLTQQLARSLGQDGAITLQLQVDDLDIDFDQAMACGLIINELVANSFQHAFPGGAFGTVRISLGPGPDGLCRLRVTDDGRGLPEHEPGGTESSTLGASLVAMLVRQLKGSLSVGHEAGTDVTIDFIPRAAVSEAVS